MIVFRDEDADHGIDPVWWDHLNQDDGLIGENQGKRLDTHYDRAKDQLIFFVSLLFPQEGFRHHISLMHKCNYALFNLSFAAACSRRPAFL